MKIVVSVCYGGFNISHEGVLEYARQRGLTIYPERDPEYEKLDMVTYWLVPPEQRTGILSYEEFCEEADMSVRAASNKRHSELVLRPRDIERNDPDLVAVVEQLGDRASGQFSALVVVEIPDDVQWEIAEYDGLEHVAEKHRTWSA